jgi:hypothetical protein
LSPSRPGEPGDVDAVRGVLSSPSRPHQSLAAGQVIREAATAKGHASTANDRLKRS